MSPSAEGSLAAQGRGPGQYVVVLKDEKESAWGKDVPAAVQALETRHVVVKAEKTYQHALHSFRSETPPSRAACLAAEACRGDAITGTYM